MATTIDNPEMAPEPQTMWEIFVPSERPDHHHPRHKSRYFRTRYHKVWDARVREIAGGLTIMPKAKGQWVSLTGEVVAEGMIPVRVIATESEIDRIIQFTLGYYDQDAVLCYSISTNVKLHYRDSQGRS